MKHAIGFNISKVKKGEFVSFRNFYDCKEDAEWEELVCQGLAKKGPDPLYSGYVVYHLTQDGKELLSEILSVKIVNVLRI